jgi:hypothetical protein
MDVDDFFIIQENTWTSLRLTFPNGRARLQQATIQLIQAGTGQRPAALVARKRNKQKVQQYYPGWENDILYEHQPVQVSHEAIQGILYKDVRLVLLPNPEGSRDLLLLELDIRNTKGSERKPIP